MIGCLSNPVKLKEDLTELTSNRPITAPDVQFEGMNKKAIERAGNVSSLNSSLAKVTRVVSLNSSPNGSNNIIPAVLAIDQPGRFVIQDPISQVNNKRYKIWRQI